MFLFSTQKSKFKAKVPMLSLGWSQAPSQPRHTSPSPTLGGLRYGGPAGQHGVRVPGVVGVSHVAVHHESQEWGLAALQVVHMGPVGDVSIAVKEAC